MDHSTDCGLLLSLWTKPYSGITSPTHLDICNWYNRRRQLATKLTGAVPAQIQLILIIEKHHHSLVITTFVNESGNPTNTYTAYNLYSEDPLWDGEQCENEGVCYSNENSPPWFAMNPIKVIFN